MSKLPDTGEKDDVTAVMDSTQFQAMDPQDDRKLHDVTPEVAERRSLFRRLKELLAWVRVGELRDSHAEIEADYSSAKIIVPYREQVSENLLDIAELYDVGEEFASGGQSVLHFAIDRQLGRTVAIKSLKERPDDPEGSRQAFLHEARVTARLDHPGVLPAYSLMRDRANGLHLAMRYASGMTLQKYLRALIRLYSENGTAAYDIRKNLFRRLEYFLRVCDVMEYAHARNVLHCDLKPENIIIGSYHDVYVMDWGIARAAEDGREWTAPTKVTGTLRYLAPEIIRGSRPTVRSDVFSLGAILYEIVSLNNAYAGDSPAAIVQKQKSGRIGDFRHRFGCRIDGDLKAIVQKAIQPDPEQRYPSVAALSADIRRLRRNEEVSARPDPPVGKFIRWCANHPQSIAGRFIALVLMLVAGLGFSAERSIHSAMDQRDYDAAVSGVFARSTLAAQSINTRMGRYVQLLNNLMEDYLMLRRAGLPPEWSEHALTVREINLKNGPAAASLAPSAAYRWQIDFRHLVYMMPPGVSISEEDRQNLRILSFMVPRLRHLIFKYSLGANRLAGLSQTEIEARIREQGASPHRISFGFPDGLFGSYPGMARSSANIDPRRSAWYLKACKLPPNQCVWGNPYVENAAAAGRRITCSMPIYDDGEVFRAVITLELDLGLMSRRMASLGNNGPHVRGKYVFDRHGRIYLSLSREPTRSRLLFSPVVELAHRRQYGT